MLRNKGAFSIIAIVTTLGLRAAQNEVGRFTLPERTFLTGFQNDKTERSEQLEERVKSKLINTPAGCV